MTIDPATAGQLKSDATYARAVPATPWPVAGDGMRRISPYVFVADAEAEAARIAAMLGRPVVVDRLSVAGRQHRLIGRGVTIQADRLGYQGGVAAFVIGAAEGPTDTVLTVVRSLA